MLKDKTFEEVVSIMNALNPTKLKHLHDLALKINCDDDKLYSKTFIDVNINANTKRTLLSYHKKIGYDLHNEMKELLTRRGQKVLMISNAGSGKTYTQLKVASELDLESDDANVVYVFTVPGSKQSNQNEAGDDLWEFGFKSIVGKKNKLETDDGEHFVKKLKKGHRKFSCVYDLTLDVVQESKQRGLEVVLIVDEAHKLVSKFRGEAIAGIEEAMNISDMVVMMTATPEKCELHYKYDEILELEDKDAQYNIKELEIVYTDEWQSTLRREIAKAVKNGLRPLVNLSISLEDIDALKQSLESDGYIVEVASSTNTKSKVFEAIIKDGIIPDGIDVVLATSTIEAGISIKSQDIVPMMVCNDVFKFSSDNTTQFFARPRKQVEKGILILSNKFEDINKVLADMKTNGKNDEYRKVYKLENYMNRVNAEANEIILSMGRDLKELIKMYGIRVAIDHIKDRINREFRYTRSLVVFDEYNLDFYIDRVAVINRACQLRDMTLVSGGILELQTHFIGKIFYEKLTMRYDNLEAITDDEKKALKESIKIAKEKKKEHNKEKKLKEESYREYFKDKEFLRLLPDLVSDKLDVMTIKQYDTSIKLRELLAFKQSSLYNIVVKASVHLTIDEIAEMVVSRYNGNNEYISLSDMEKICDVASNVTQNKLETHKNDKSSYNVLVNIIDDLKTKGNTRKPEKIMLSRDLFVILYSELIRTGHYQSPAIKEKLKDAPSKKKFNYKTYYTSEKISSLEEELVRKNDNKKRFRPSTKAKLIKEIERIYNTSIVVKGENEYLNIDAKLKKFDFKYTIENTLNSK